MLSVNANKNLWVRSLSLAKVLWFGVHWLRGGFVAVCCLWALVFLVDYATPSTQIVASVMIAPLMLQLAIVMFIIMRASQLLMNSQLHLMGVRKEVFINCLSMSAIFTLFIYDPKSSENLVIAKLVIFSFISAIVFWLFWVFCLQLMPMMITGLLVIACAGLIFLLNIKIALAIFNLLLWSHFAYWLWRSPLQRQFKFEYFSGLVDYVVERLNIDFFRRALTLVKHKEHVLLMGEGDGYINRILLAPIFSLLFTFLYVLLMPSMPELCLWMILLHLGGTKAKVKVIQSPAKLWLLSDGDRRSLFAVSENISLRLNIYPFLTACGLLLIWSVLNPNLIVHGLVALGLCLLCVIAVDYFVGMVASVGTPALLIGLLVKMAFMFFAAHAHLGVEWYLFIAIALLVSCIVFRQRALQKFLVANLSAANSSARAS